jgi:hypothetical protein
MTREGFIATDFAVFSCTRGDPGTILENKASIEKQSGLFAKLSGAREVLCLNLPFPTTDIFTHEPLASNSIRQESN